MAPRETFADRGPEKSRLFPANIRLSQLLLLPSLQNLLRYAATWFFFGRFFFVSAKERGPPKILFMKEKLSSKANTL